MADLGANLARRLWALLLLLLLGACSLPQVSAESRLFAPLSLEPLGEYALPVQPKGQPSLTGLIGLTYDRQQGRFYAVTSGPDSGPDAARSPHLVRLSLDLGSEVIAGLKVEAAQPLAVPAQTWQPGSLVLAPQQRWAVSQRGAVTAVQLFDQMGQLQASLRLPKYYQPDQPGEAAQGTQPGRGLATLSMSQDGERLFTATAAPLIQDGLVSNRLLHYLFTADGQPLLISEHLYPLDATELGELLCLSTPGTFLALERPADAQGESQLYQVSTAGATDVSGLSRLGPSSGVTPMQKKLLLAHLSGDFRAMSLGPALPSGGRAVLLVGTQADQTEKLLLFRLSGLRS